jgi:hypothetical protein
MTPGEYALERVATLEKRVEDLESKVDDVNVTLREAIAAVKTGLWVLGGLWGVGLAIMALLRH